MTTRSRIRSLKPDLWQDEKVGAITREARLLFIGLITMADDDGRLRELVPAIVGTVYPYDNLPPAKLHRWLKDLELVSLIVRYEVAGKRYVAIPNFRKHQRISHPKDSTLPPPPAWNGRGTTVEEVRT